MIGSTCLPGVNRGRGMPSYDAIHSAEWPLTFGRSQVPGPNGLNPSPTVHTFRHECQQLEEVCLVLNSLQPSGVERSWRTCPDRSHYTGFKSQRGAQMFGVSTLCYIGLVSAPM